MSATLAFTGWNYAFAAGLFGATFFMLVEFQRRLPESGTTELRELWTIRMIGLRCAVGIGGATILYFLFQTELLGGAGLWPNIGNLTFKPLSGSAEWWLFGEVEFRLPGPNTARLIVWCFLAGYSQGLVPSILAHTSRRGQPKAS